MDQVEWYEEKKCYHHNQEKVLAIAIGAITPLWCHLARLSYIQCQKVVKSYPHIRRAEKPIGSIIKALIINKNMHISLISVVVAALVIAVIGVANFFFQASPIIAPTQKAVISWLALGLCIVIAAILVFSFFGGHSISIS